MHARRYTHVLADDLTGNGKMDLLLSTMNGNLYCFETPTPYTPLRGWRAQAQGRNVWQQREGFQGVVIEGASGRHAPRKVAGATFELDFTIHDHRRAPRERWHRVEVRLGRKQLLLNRTYYHAPASGSSGSSGSGSGLHQYREELPCPDTRAQGVLTVSMVNEHGQLFEDSIAVSFNGDFALVLKWVALVPFVVTIAAVAFAASRDEGGALLGI